MSRPQSDIDVLNALTEGDGQVLTINEICESAGMVNCTVWRALDRLGDDGYVTGSFGLPDPSVGYYAPTEKAMGAIQ